MVLVEWRGKNGKEWGRVRKWEGKGIERKEKIGERKKRRGKEGGEEKREGGRGE